MQRLWTRDFILVTVSAFFVFLNLQMITPALSSYIHAGIGNNRDIGFSTAAWAVTAVITRIFAGKAIMSVNKKKLLVLGLIVYVIATAAYYFATSMSVLLVVRVLYGIGFGLSTTTLGTVAADIIPALRIGEGMGYFGLSTSLAMALAPLIGIGLYNGLGFHSLVYVSTALVLAAALLTPLLRIHKTGHVNAPGQTNQSNNQNRKKRLSLHDFYDRSIVLPCVLLLLMSITYGGLVSYITLFGNEIHIANAGWFFLVNALVVVLVRPFSGKLFDKKGHAAVLPIGAISLVVGLVLLSYSLGMTLFLVAAIFYGMGYGILQPALQAWLFQRLSPERRGIGSGAFYNSMDFGIAFGSVLLGAVANVTGYTLMYRLSSLCMVFFLIIYVSFGFRESSNKRSKKGMDSTVA